MKSTQNFTNTGDWSIRTIYVALIYRGLFSKVAFSRVLFEPKAKNYKLKQLRLGTRRKTMKCRGDMTIIMII